MNCLTFMGVGVGVERLTTSQEWGVRCLGVCGLISFILLFSLSFFFFNKINLGVMICKKIETLNDTPNISIEVYLNMNVTFNIDKNKAIPIKVLLFGPHTLIPATL